MRVLSLKRPGVYVIVSPPLLLGTAAWNDWRIKNANVTPDLTGADLAGMDLSGKDLKRSDLTRADLSRATLAGTDFTRATLRDTLAGTRDTLRMPLRCSFSATSCSSKSTWR